MDHVTAIRKYIEAIANASDMHALIVVGSSGWGKSVAVAEALNEAGIDAIQLGSYSTSLHLYNTLADHSNYFIVLDDCSGVLSDPTSMAILKAATWPSQDGRRIVKWGSTSSKANVSEFDFSGKLIIVCNTYPETSDAQAVSSRAYTRRIDVTLSQAQDLLLRAADDSKWFENNDLAAEVARFLTENLNHHSLPHISFRTLKKGYRLAEVHRDSWPELLLDTIPKSKENPKKLVLELASGGLKIKDQIRIFEERCGLKRRSFYNYRREVGLA